MQLVDNFTTMQYTSRLNTKHKRAEEHQVSEYDQIGIIKHRRTDYHQMRQNQWNFLELGHSTADLIYQFHKERNMAEKVLLKFNAASFRFIKMLSFENKSFLENLMSGIQAYTNGNAYIIFLRCSFSFMGIFSVISVFRLYVSSCTPSTRVRKTKKGRYGVKLMFH